MVRADPRTYILPGLLAAETGGVAIDGFAGRAAQACDLGYKATSAVFMKDAGEVHHFAEVFDVVTGEELGDFGGFEGGAPAAL